uniref:Solute carrier family 41 member n=1 Tax=Hucho hucho TaxID=62062 RepID=A0A4W5RWJ0_9TELE
HFEFKLYGEGPRGLRCPGQCPISWFTSESVRSMVLQILVPFLLAGLGTVSAGMLPDVVPHWEVFQRVTEIFILVPSIVHTGCMVNVGKMETAREKWSLIIGNLAQKQMQATVLGLLAALAAVVLAWVLEGEMFLSHTALLCSASVAMVFMASMLQGMIVVGVIIGCKRIGINPDNVANPIAASFGDLITLACLSQGLYECIEYYPYVSYLVCLIFLCLTHLWVVVSSRNAASFTAFESCELYGNTMLQFVFFSSIGGLILDTTVSDPNMVGMIVYTPVMNRVGENLVVPEDRRSCYNPCRTFCGSANHRSAQVLLLSVRPIHIFTLLCLADWMVHCLWRTGKDPDSYSIQYLTALWIYWARPSWLWPSSCSGS